MAANITPRWLCPACGALHDVPFSLCPDCGSNRAAVPTYHCKTHGDLESATCPHCDLLDRRTGELAEAQKALACGHWHKALALCDELDADSRNFPGVSEVRRQAQAEGERQEREERERLALEAQERRETEKRLAAEKALTEERRCLTEQWKRRLGRSCRIAAPVAVIIACLAVWGGIERRFARRKAVFHAAVESRKDEAALRVAPLIAKRYPPAAQYLAAHGQAQEASKAQEAARYAGAYYDAKEPWNGAVRLAEAAQTAFDNGQSEEATPLWESARAEFAKAGEAAKVVRVGRLIAEAEKAKRKGDLAGTKVWAERALNLDPASAAAKALLGGIPRE